MSMSVNLHTKRADELDIRAYVETRALPSNPYPVVVIQSYENGVTQDVTLFSTVEQLEDLIDHLKHVVDEMAKVTNK